ncbi:MAG: TIGR01777 family protein [Gammaproteobacteria bacterium]|nr:TIGR01777 family protein [Gammaproteobacteria bacterium]
MEKVLITGGTGFIGRHLIPALEQSGYKVLVKSRTPEKFKDDFFFRNVDFYWDFDETPPADAVVNLCGENLANKRWTVKQKRKIYTSRIEETIKLVDWIDKQEEKPHTFISGSAIGFYGSRGDEILNEKSEHGDLKEFQVKLCNNWELSAKRAASMGIRTSIIRTGVVLGDDGALSKMLTPFKLGLGGKLGTGKQWFSWIHIQDQVSAMMHILKDPNLFGLYNLTAPNPVTNAELTQKLASKLGKKASLNVPAFALKLRLGEFANLLLTGQKVLPEALQHSGFEFQYPTLDAALEDLIDI